MSKSSISTMQVYVPIEPTFNSSHFRFLTTTFVLTAGGLQWNNEDFTQVLPQANQGKQTTISIPLQNDSQTQIEAGQVYPRTNKLTKPDHQKGDC